MEMERLRDQLRVSRKEELIVREGLGDAGGRRCNVVELALECFRLNQVKLNRMGAVDLHLVEELKD